MDKIKAHIESQEEVQQQRYENFYIKNKTNQFLNDLSILKFRFYHYKEFVKIFANNFYSDKFQGSRQSFYSTLFLPTAIMIGFDVINPFSIFRRIAIFGSCFGSMISFYFNMKDELYDIARQDKGVLGDNVRNRFKELAAFDALVLSFREEDKRIHEEKHKNNNL